MSDGANQVYLTLSVGRHPHKHPLKATRQMRMRYTYVDSQPCTEAEAISELHKRIAKEIAEQAEQLALGMVQELYDKLKKAGA